MNKMERVNSTQAEKFGISLTELQSLVGDKNCSVYPNTLLHVRRTRGGKVTVFSISERARSEKISTTKKSRKGKTRQYDQPVEANL